MLLCFAISFLSERSKAHVFVDASFTHQFCTLHVYSFVKVRRLQKTIARLLKKTGICRRSGGIAHSKTVQIYLRSPGRMIPFGDHLSTRFVKGEGEVGSEERASSAAFHAPFPVRFRPLVQRLYNIRYDPRSVKGDCKIKTKSAPVAVFSTLRQE